MAHVRETIRSNIVTVFTGVTTTGSNGFDRRHYPLESSNLPALCVYTLSEETEYATMTVPRTQLRTLNVAVEAYVKGTGAIDNTIDTIAVQVEEALDADLTRDGNAKDTQITAVDIDYNAEGEQPLGIAKFNVVVLYETLENDVETAV